MSAPIILKPITYIWADWIRKCLSKLIFYFSKNSSKKGRQGCDMWCMCLGAYSATNNCEVHCVELVKTFDSMEEIFKAWVRNTLFQEEKIIIGGKINFSFGSIYHVINDNHFLQNIPLIFVLYSQPNFCWNSINQNWLSPGTTIFLLKIDKLSLWYVH